MLPMGNLIFRYITFSSIKATGVVLSMGEWIILQFQLSSNNGSLTKFLCILSKVFYTSGNDWNLCMYVYLCIYV